ncbi:MAG: HIT domain-containing protein [Rhodothermales bacterium]
MEHLWSPWRRAHLEAEGASATPRGEGTLFERLANAGDDEANLIAWRGAHVFVILNKYPYNNGHVMIVPYRPVTAFQALTAAEQVEMAGLIGHCMEWLTVAFRPDGFNVGLNQGKAGGAGVPDHLHMHIVPRWSGDTNFMPVTGRAKVIPEALEVSYRKICAAIAAEAAEDQ